MTALSLKERYDNAIALLKGENGADEVTVLLHKTPWVRILLDQDQKEGDSPLIEVEISIPDSNETEPSVLIDGLYEHLQYIQRLREIGFELSVIGTGCIYCASKEFHETPADDLFRALIPP